jgi:UDP-GlcNAc:undecaprenyl-phosphate GlcNAc-1-phosphate transferase
MTSTFVLYFVTTFVLAALATPAVRSFARTMGVMDTPSKERKVHTKPIALLGGVAVIGSFILGVLLAWPHLVGGFITERHLIGVLCGAVLIGIGGALDDKYDLSPGWQFIWPLLAVVVVMFSGIGVSYITNPAGGVFRLDQWTIQLPFDFSFALIADTITIIWLLGMMYTTKFLDGLDGLVPGVTVIGAFILFFVSMLPQLNQPQPGLLALIVAAAFAGFLLFNWHPASIFLGEGGSLFAGFTLGVLSIIAGTKIATSLLILGIPILDVLWVIVRRVIIEKRSPFQGDRKHLHLRLIDIGFSHRQAVLTLYFLTFVFGVTSLFLQTRQKFVALFAMALVMVLLGLLLVKKRRANKA